MDIIISKRLKSFTTKAIIVVMSFLYTLGPAHTEVNTFLHTIVHALEKPDVMLSHSKSIKKSNHAHNKGYSYVKLQHDHKIIELVNSILEGTTNQENRSPEKEAVVYKIDKHTKLIESLTYKKQETFYLETKAIFTKIDDDLCRGFCENIKKPPQNKNYI
jgi:hypothetical protein